VQPRAGLGIAFEGCGCRAAFHVGVMETLLEERLMPAAVAGASSGALIAGATALGAIADLRPVWTELLGSRVCDFRRLLRGKWPYCMSDIVSGVAARYFGDRRLGDAPIPLSIVVTELRGARFLPRALTAADDITIARAVLASCFIPGPYSRIVPIDGRLTFDGAWLLRVPLFEPARLGARKVIACVTDHRGRILTGAARPKPYTPPGDLDYRVLFPAAPLPVATFDFDRSATLETFAIGRESAQQFVAQHRDWL
jgi:NTE family protein